MEDPIDLLVKEIEGNLGFLEDLVKKNNLIIGTVGFVVVLMAIV